MATLSSLPSELILLICNEIYPPGVRHLAIPTNPGAAPSSSSSPSSPSSALASLSALAALARTSRRLLQLAEPILYRRGVACHHHLPLAWAARFGIEPTLRKALAAGASPAFTFRSLVPAQVCRLADDVHRANLDWASNNPSYWPPFDDRGLAGVFMPEPGATCWRSYLTPERIDVAPPALFPAHPSDADGDPGPPRHAHFRRRNGRTEVDLDREYTALHLAAKEGHTEMASTLLDHGARLDAQSRIFCRSSLRQIHFVTPVLQHTHRCPTALDLSICSSRADTARLLISRTLAHAGPLDAPSASNYGLHRAAAAGLAGLVEHILETYTDLDVDLPDDEGFTAFAHACAHRRWDSTIPLLLARGANIDASFELMYYDHILTLTPLGNACRLGRFEDAIKLIDLGADASRDMVLAPTDTDDQPAQASIPLLHLCCMARVSSYVITSQEERRHISMQASSRAPLVHRLLASGTSPHARWRPARGDDRGETALSVAVRHLNVSAVRALVDAGVDVHADTWHGRTALMLVALSFECQVCSWSDQIPPWLRDGILRCPHVITTEAPFDEKKLGRVRPTIARLLLDAGAQVNHEDQDGNTVLHLLFLKPPDAEAPQEWMASDVSNQILHLLLSRDADPYRLNNAGESAVRLAVDARDVHALHVMSDYARVDLMGRLPWDEIAAIFEALPWSSVARRETSEMGGTQPGRRTNAGHDDGWDSCPESPRTASSTNSDPGDRPCDEHEAWNLSRLVGALMGMDSSGGLGLFFCARILKAHQAGAAAVLADTLYARGLERAPFHQEARQAMLRLSILARHWRMAEQLLHGLPEVSDINLRGENGHTLLALVTSSNFHRKTCPEIDIQLVDAGADVHFALNPATVGPQGVPLADVNLMTPLKQALRRPAAFDITWMLERQPIRGNPCAAAPLYLHWAVDQLDDEGDGLFWPVKDASIKALLAAGADTAQLDSRGNTALATLLEGLLTRPNVVRHTYHWIKPLSRAVDINHRNDHGWSVADDLRSLLGQPSAARYLEIYVRLVKLESGEREIQWLN